MKIEGILIELKKNEAVTINEINEFISLKKKPSKENGKYIARIMKRQQGKGTSPALDSILFDLKIIYNFEELDGFHVISNNLFKDHLDKIEYLGAKLKKYEKGASYSELPQALYKTEIKYLTFKGNEIEGNVLYRGSGSLIFKAKDKDEYYLDAVYSSGHMLSSKLYKLDNEDIYKLRGIMISPHITDRRLEKLILILLHKYHH